MTEDNNYKYSIDMIPTDDTNKFYLGSFSLKTDDTNDLDDTEDLDFDVETEGTNYEITVERLKTIIRLANEAIGDLDLLQDLMIDFNK